jgi:hypothetical protein
MQVTQARRADVATPRHSASRDWKDPRGLIQQAVPPQLSSVALPYPKYTRLFQRTLRSGLTRVQRYARAASVPAAWASNPGTCGRFAAPASLPQVTP